MTVKPMAVGRPAWRTPEFGSAALRGAATAASVLVFGLSPPAAVILYVFEAWIFISTRATLEVAIINHRQSDLRGLLKTLPLQLLASGSLFGLMLGTFAFAVSGGLYGANGHVDVITSVGKETGLLGGLAALLVVGVIDAVGYAKRLLGGFEPPPGRLMLSFMRVAVLLLPAGLLSAIHASPPVAGCVMLVSIVLAILFYEGLPNIARRSMKRQRE